VFAGADRLNPGAANAFLKTLEEPPAGSVILMLSTEPDRVLETILSRCLQLSFGAGTLRMPEAVRTWVTGFAREVGAAKPGLLPRYRLLGNLLEGLASARASVEETLSAESPLAHYPDAAADQKERWEKELSAGIEAEYRRRRGEFLAGLQAWIRDVWLCASGQADGVLFLPEIGDVSGSVAARGTAEAARSNLDAWEQTQRLLHTNVQEALALEVGLLRLHL
jgi:DNA polymerase-3 subunit delta'